MMTSILRKGSVPGFTLIEVMLALALTAMLLGLLSTGVFIVAEDWNRNTDVLDETLDEALAVLQIDRALHGAFPLAIQTGKTFPAKFILPVSAITLAG